MKTPAPAKADAAARRAWLWALAWTAGVLLLGGAVGSAEATSRFIGPLLRWLLPDAPTATLDAIHFAIRKGAHLTEYGALALLAQRALRHGAGGSAPRAAVLALGWVAGVAALDESHQAALATRTASPADVALDLLGALVALALAFAYTRGMATARPRAGG